MNLRRALMKGLLLSSSITSMWTAHVVRHVKRTAHLLLVAWHPSVFLVTTDHGPNVSTPTELNDKLGISLSDGRSAIFGHSCLPQSFRHFTWWRITDKIKHFAPTMHKPLFWTAPSVISLHWYFTSSWQCEISNFATCLWDGIMMGCFSSRERSDFQKHLPTLKIRYCFHQETVINSRSGCPSQRNFLKAKNVSHFHRTHFKLV